jgi:hypothetical protein
MCSYSGCGNTKALSAEIFYYKRSGSITIGKRSMTYQQCPKQRWDRLADCYPLRLGSDRMHFRLVGPWLQMCPPWQRGMIEAERLPCNWTRTDIDVVLKISKAEHRPWPTSAPKLLPKVVGIVQNRVECKMIV